MKKIFQIVFIVQFFMGSFFYSFSSEKEDSLTWKEKMGHFAGILSSLLSDIAQQEKNFSIERAKKIEKNAAQLSEMAHKVESGKMADADPSLEFVSGMFSDEMNRGYQALSSGNSQYAYRIFKSASKYCIACHTRMEKTPLDFGDLSKVTKGLGPYEKAEILGALQQFDASVDSYKTIISDTDHAKYFHVEWERALKRALTVSIRVKEDPKLALEIIELAAANKNTPGEFKDILAVWKKSVMEWDAHRSKKEFTASEYFNQASVLYKKGENKKDYFYDPKSFIELIRASSYFHHALKDNKLENKNFQAEALFRLGFIYETLGDLELWNLHELYYETCIRRFSQTSWSQKCYDKYSESVIAGYSGSAGTHLPSEVKKKLNDLKKLSVKSSNKKK